MATRYCETCGQPVLGTDNTCWHCGAALGPIPIASASPDATKPFTPPRAPYAALYAGLTGVIALALLLVTVSLGRRPLLLQGVTGGAGDWVALSGSGGRYRVHVPANWTWLQAKDAPSQEALAERVAANEQMRVALAPLAERLSGSELLLLAESEEAFLLLSRSPTLAGLDADDLASALRQETFPNSTISEISVIANEADQQGTLLNVEQRDPALRCRQLVLPGEARGYLATACTADLSGAQDDVFLTLLGSLHIRE